MATEIDIANSTNDQAVKSRIDAVVQSYKGAAKDFASVFIGLCERFTGKDSTTGSMFEHLLNKLGDDQKSLRGAVIARLQDFSGDSLNIEFIADKGLWKVETKKIPKMKDGKPVKDGLKIVYTDKSAFKKELFIANVAKAKQSANPLKPLEKSETEEEKQARLQKAKHDRFVNAVKNGKAKDQLAENLKQYVSTVLEATDETPETLKIKLTTMINSIFNDEKPALEGEVIPANEPA
ncbi:hypothetical protein G4E03_003464 [Salmonella enterica]|nr:hypothetical protein [Salmonella enterica]